MGDNEIIKALEAEIKRANYIESEYIDCVNVEVFQNALDLINRQKIESNKYRNRVQSQKGEITRLHKKVAELTAELEEQKAEILELQKRIINWRVDMDYRPDEIKSEAMKEFAERLKERLTGIGRSTTYGNFEYGTIKSYELDNLVKEMTEVNDE